MGRFKWHLTLLALFLLLPPLTLSAQTAVPDLTAHLLHTLGSDPHIPTGTILASYMTDQSHLTVSLRLPEDFLISLSAEESDDIVMSIVQAADPIGFDHITVLVAGKSGHFVPISDYLPAPPPLPATNPPPRPADWPLNPVSGQGRPQGALSGKSVWLSAGHGWEWNTGLADWRTQRTTTFGLVEDFASAEAVNYYLARYLWNAGADVWLVRERNMNPNEVIVDNDDGAAAYSETGSWSTSGTPGYNGLTYRFAGTNAAATATATWTPIIPVTGWYGVSVWYLESGNRAHDTRFIINHAGGSSTVSVSQEVHGQTWRYLGEYYFEEGTSGSVSLINQSDDLAGGQVVIADAVRFGGGMGNTDYGGGVSGKERWEEGALTYTAFQGFDTTGSNEVTSRPRYAEWELSKGYAGEDAVYISWHTNAGGGTGTETFIYNGGFTPGSDLLQDWIHTEMIDDIRSEWDPTWADRGQKSANFGEIRELTTMPGTLLEIAFHDNNNDADALKTPLFRHIAARSVAQGIIKYFADRDGTAVNLPPEPPQNLQAVNRATTEVTLSWAASAPGGAGGDPATGYLVYMSSNGKGFADGIPVISQTLTLSGLNPDSRYFFRVSATNSGGESFPTPVTAVQTPPFGSGIDFLIIDGFDRLDSSAMISQNDGPILGMTQRMFLERMNRFDYAIEHAAALASCGYSFDGTDNNAVINGAVSLTSYPALNWFTGEDGTGDDSLNVTERSLISSYLDNGGGLLISGAEIGYDLARPTFGEDPAFYQNYLKSGYGGDSSGTYNFTAVGGPYAGISGSFDDSSQGYYDVRFPDRLTASGGSNIVLNYSGGTGDGAGTLYNGTFRVANFGFPLESITDEAVRNNLICTAAAELMMIPPCMPPVAATAAPLITGNDLQINWSLVAGAERYELFSNVIPYQAPAPGSFTTAVFAPAMSINITNALAGGSSFYYYLLSGNHCGGLAPDANHFGVFNFMVIPGS